MELHDDHHTKNLTLTLALERFMMRRQPRESDYDDWEIPVNVDPFIYLRLQSSQLRNEISEIRNTINLHLPVLYSLAHHRIAVN